MQEKHRLWGSLLVLPGAKGKHPGPKTEVVNHGTAHCSGDEMPMEGTLCPEGMGLVADFWQLGGVDP
jgi:hypothetical protein